MFKQGLLSLAIIGAGALGLSSVSANAVTVPFVPNPVIQGDNLVEVTHRPGHSAREARRDRREARRDRREDRRERRWDRRRHGDRCLRRLGGCRHYYRGYYYETPWWTLPLIGGSIILNSGNYNRGSGNAHVRWCRDRYRSYNVRTNTWVSYSGQVRQCNSPYN